MKSWILKQIIAISEITGWAVPRSMRKRVSENELARMRQKEAELTAALRQGSGDAEELPPFLEARIEAALAREEAASRPVSRVSWLGMPALSAAAAVVVISAGVLFVLRPETPSTGLPGETQSVVATAETPEAAALMPETTTPAMEKERKLLTEDMLVKPLIQEQARLAADMTNALRFMADSFLPRDYAQRVNNNLNSLEEDLAGSI